MDPLHHIVLLRKLSFMEAQNITFHYDGNINPVLKNASFSVEKGEHIALVGPNGSGKSTLLKLLAGALQPQSGVVHRNNHEVLYLPQEIYSQAKVSVLNWLYDQLGLAELSKQLDKQLEAGLDDEANLQKWGELRQRFEALDGDNFESNLEEAKHQVPLVDFSLHQSVTTLSGGQGQRLKLLLIALAKHDFVFLDEPTNDLDIDGILWLENWIGETKSGIIIVSHDRQLLNKVVNHVAAIDSRTGKILKANCSYGEFLEQLAGERQQLLSIDAQQRKEIKELKRKIAQAQTKASKKSSKTKQSDRDKLGQTYRGERAASQATAKVKSLKKLLERIVTIQLPKEYEMRLDYQVKPIQSPIALHFENINIEFDGKQFGPYSGDILSKDRLAIIGPNGVGKTTLLGMLFKKQSQSGQVRLASDANVFFIPQNRWLGANQSVWELVAKQVNIPEGEAKTKMAQYGLTKDIWRQEVSTLSSGQRTRLLTCLVNLQRPNFLVLDEPTNHLDMEAIEAIEKGLIKFAGTLVIVSHDQIFLRNIGCNKVWEISPTNIIVVPHS
jgi:ATPase subunit of ABC transporter with duplicated ATPase domains